MRHHHKLMKNLPIHLMRVEIYSLIYPAISAMDSTPFALATPNATNSLAMPVNISLNPRCILYSRFGNVPKAHMIFRIVETNHVIIVNGFRIGLMIQLLIKSIALRIGYNTAFIALETARRIIRDIHPNIISIK